LNVYLTELEEQKSEENKQEEEEKKIDVNGI
jgi:hypothetical protein